MKQWKNLAEKDYLADIKPTSKRAKGVAVEKITLYTDQNIGGFKAKIVEELPEVGEDGILYLILKEEAEEGDTYDEYIWVEKEGGERGFEHIGATDKVEITLYDSTGQNTDGAMTQKAVTDALDGKADSSSLSPVATSGDYNDLENTPSIPTPVNVVQTTGTSTTDVMSQNAVTSMVFADPGTNRRVQIGHNASASLSGTAIGPDASASLSGTAIGPYAKAFQGCLAFGGYAEATGSVSTAIGSNTGNVYNTRASGQYAVAIGPTSRVSGTESTALGTDTTVSGSYSVALGGQATASHTGSVALGYKATTTANGQVQIGTSVTSYGYNSSNYRLLSGLYEPQSAHDAANKEYVDTQIGAIGTALQTLLNGGES